MSAAMSGTITMAPTMTTSASIVSATV